MKIKELSKIKNCTINSLTNYVSLAFGIKNIHNLKGELGIMLRGRMENLLLWERFYNLRLNLGVELEKWDWKCKNGGKVG